MSARGDETAQWGIEKIVFELAIHFGNRTVWMSGQEVTVAWKPLDLKRIQKKAIVIPGRSIFINPSSNASSLVELLSFLKLEHLETNMKINSLKQQGAFMITLCDKFVIC